MMMCVAYGVDVVCFPSLAQWSMLCGGVLAVLVLAATVGRRGK